MTDRTFEETDTRNLEYLGTNGNNAIWRDAEVLDDKPYKINNHGNECCICLESKYRMYKCGKCNDGNICINCFKQNTKITNYVYPRSNCILDAENLMLLTHKCPICRDYRGEDLTEPTRKKYEFTETEFCKKILEFNKNKIELFGSYRITDEMFESDADWVTRMRNGGLVGDEDSDYRSDDEEHEDEDEEDGLHLEDWINHSLLRDLCSIHGLTGEDRERQADRQSRQIDVISNVYTLNLLFNEHFDWDDN